MALPRRKLGTQGFEVSAQGLGCMGMSAFYGTPKPEDEMIEVIHKAVDLGVTFLDTADIYGPHANEVLVGKAIKGIREKVQVATKFAIVAGPSDKMVRGEPEYVRKACEDSLARLDTPYIDLYYAHRIDQTVPIEVTVGAMKKLVEEGKVKYLGLSEASVDTIRRAHAVHPITAIQLEWSLWTRDVEEDIIPLCRELGIGIVAYSPLGRGFFSGKAISEQLEETDWRNKNPRFEGASLDKNRVFYERLSALAKAKGATPGQYALAWLQNQGEDVVPIPGTTKVKNLQENIGAVGLSLSKQELDEIAAAVPHDQVDGERYASNFMSLCYKSANTPPLSSWQGSA